MLMCVIYIYLRILVSNTISISDDVSDSNTTGVTCVAGTVYPSGAHDVTHGF